MNYDEFTGQVQHRLALPGTGEAVRAIRATLTTLGRRVQEGEARDLAGSLPMEIGWYPVGPIDEHGERFDWREFVARVAESRGRSRRRQAATRRWGRGRGRSPVPVHPTARDGRSEGGS